MKKFTWFFILLLWVILPAYSDAQTSGISGKITDSVTGEMLADATIRTANAGTQSDEKGEYKLNLAPGSYDVQFSYIGFVQKTIRITINEGELKNLNVSLYENATILQTTTVTAGKYETPLAEATVSLEVIKPSLIENTGSTTIDKVLDKIPSINIIDGQVNIRGGSGFSYGAGSRVLLLIDDLPALQADAGYTRWSDVPVENIEQVEVLKGAASALYGSAAMNGIINIRTGYARSVPETKAAIYARTVTSPADASKKWWHTPPVEYGAQILHKQRFNKLDVILGGFYSGGDQFIKDTYDRYFRINTGLRYRINNRLSIGVNLLLNDGESQSYFLWQNKDAGAWIGDTNTLSNSRKLNYFIDPSIVYFDKFGNKHKLLGRINKADNRNNANQSNSSNTYYGEYQVQREFSNLKLITTAGITETFSNIEAALYSNQKFSIENRAVYLQLDKKFGSRLSFSLGGRYEFNKINVPKNFLRDSFNTEAKPVFRSGLNYQLGQATYLRASFGQGYRFPTIAEKFIRTSFSNFQIFPNDTLRSETGWSAELGLKQGFKIDDWYGFVDVASYWTEYKDMMEFTLVAGSEGIGFRSLNIGNTIIKGFDIGVAAQGNLFGLKTSLFTGYTYLDPKFVHFGAKEMNSSSNKEENILKYRFKHSFKFDGETHYKKFALGASVIYNSDMKAIDNVFNAFIKDVKKFRDEHNKGFTIVDLRVSYQVINSLKSSFIIGNVFNTEYSWRPGRLESMRNLTLRLDYNINKKS